VTTYTPVGIAAILQFPWHNPENVIILGVIKNLYTINTDSSATYVNCLNGRNKSFGVEVLQRHPRKIRGYPGGEEIALYGMRKLFIVFAYRFYHEPTESSPRFHTILHIF
jgi:hypothetical protein